jgi:predicted negative regulator of RcsB-dependent stress response
MPNGATVLDAARRAMEAGDLEAAAVQLALVLRVSPGLAPAVLDVAGSTAGAELDLIRGDAYRLVGHEAEAQRAYASAIATLGGAAAPSQAAASVPPVVPIAPAESPREPEPPAADPPETP